jgi:hypothetical protein
MLDEDRRPILEAAQFPVPRAHGHGRSGRPKADIREFLAGFSC